MSKKHLSNDELYAKLSDRFASALDEAAKHGGLAPWQKPFKGGELSMPRNLQSGKRYRGINSFLLSLSGYSDPRWTTWQAAKKLGVTQWPGKPTDDFRTLIVLWKRFKVKDATAPDGYKIIPMLRYFSVFNVEQLEWPDGVLPELSVPAPPDDWNEINEAEATFQQYIDSDSELSLGWGGNSAHYMPALHRIQLPDREDFNSAEGFYATAFHECAHSTARALKRDITGTFGTEKYGREELVAEMTSAFVLACIGVEGDFQNSVAYLKSWAQAIRNDPKMLVKAAGQAQKAADLIQGIEYNWVPDEGPKKEIAPDAVAV